MGAYSRFLGSSVFFLVGLGMIGWVKGGEEDFRVLCSPMVWSPLTRLGDH